MGGVEIIEVSPGRGFPRGVFRRKRMAKVALKLEPDMVHCHEPDSLKIACTLKDGVGSRVVYDAHENYSLLAAMGDTSWAKRGILVRRMAGYEERCCSKTDFIFAATEPLGRLLQGYGPPVQPLYNFPRTEIFHPQKDAGMLERYGGRRVFVYTGSLARSRRPRRMVDSTLALSREYPDVVLSVLGPHPTRPLIEDLGPGERTHIEYHGFVEHPKVPLFLSVGLAGIVLLDDVPPYRVAAPIKMFEYMACGLPVIATRLAELSRFIEPHRAGILIEDDGSELLEAMKSIIEHPEESKQMGQRGLEAVRDEYNWSVSEKILNQAYEKLA
jgi:glycosyltransferase involved in cell wall biosynthesis